MRAAETGLAEPGAATTASKARRAGGEQAFGGVVWPIGGNEAHVGPRFDIAVAPGGYAWWYCDALSDDGRFGLTIIAFIGSVFSPYYAWSGRRDPLDHSAINVAIYGRNTRDTWAKGRWAMTERGRQSVEIEANALRIGPSSLTWDGTALTIEIDETSAPIPTRLKGRVRVMPDAVTRQIFGLDREGHLRNGRRERSVVVERAIGPEARRFLERQIELVDHGVAFRAGAGVGQSARDRRFDLVPRHHEGRGLDLLAQALEPLRSGVERVPVQQGHRRASGDERLRFSKQFRGEPGDAPLD